MSLRFAATASKRASTAPLRSGLGYARFVGSSSTEASSRIPHPLRISIGPARTSPQDGIGEEATPPPPLQPNLPRAELRDLFHLYHSARNFITLENLDEAIESAFAKSNKNDTFHRRNESSLFDLEKTLQARQAHDKLMQLPEVGDTSSPSKSDQPTMPPVREVAVRSALFGLDFYDNIPLPGLEAVEEELAKQKKTPQEA